MYEQLVVVGGQIAYDLVKNSQNVVELESTPFTNAIPANASPQEMSGWERYTLDLTSLTGTVFLSGKKTGVPMVDCNIYLTWLYNGRHRKRVRFISNATSYCKIKKCDSAISFNLAVAFGSPYNVAKEEEDIIVRLPFKVTASFVQKKIGFKTHDSIYEWRGEISGAEGEKNGKKVGSYSYEGYWVK